MSQSFSPTSNEIKEKYTCKKKQKKIWIGFMTLIGKGSYSHRNVNHSFCVVD